MKLITERLHREDDGFTLIELLVVILVLTILAGIAIFASAPFRDRASGACDTANQQINWTADAAEEAGATGGDSGYVRNDMFNRLPSEDCEGGTTGGGGGGGGSFTTTLENTWTAPFGSETVALTGVTAGNTLVAVSAHRLNPSSGDPGTPTMAGWTHRGTASFMQDGTNDRRAVAVFTKTASASETATVSWGAGVSDASLLVREFEKSNGGALTSATFAGTNGATGLVGSLGLGPVSGSSGSALVVAGVGTRESTTVSWSSGFAGTTQSGSVTTSTAYQSVTDGSAAHTATATFGTNVRASGFIMVLRP